MSQPAMGIQKRILQMVICSNTIHSMWPNQLWLLMFQFSKLSDGLSFFLHSFFFMMYCHKTHTHVYMYMYNNYNTDAELPERAMERYMYNYVYLLLLRHTRPRSLILVFCRLPTPHRFWCFKPLNVQRKDSGERSWHSTSESWGAMCLSETFL